MNRRRTSLFAVAVLLMASGFFAGCPATFAPTAPLGAGGGDLSASSKSGDSDKADEGTVSEIAGTGTPDIGASAAGIEKASGDSAGVDNVASNVTPSGAIAAAGDTAEAGKPQPIKFGERRVRHEKSPDQALPAPPQTSLLFALVNRTMTLPLMIDFKKNELDSFHGYPFGAQMRIVFVPQGASPNQVLYTDTQATKSQGDLVTANVVFSNLKMGDGTLSLYAYEKNEFNDAAEIVMDHTADYREGELAAPADETIFNNSMALEDMHLLAVFQVKAVAFH